MRERIRSPVCKGGKHTSVVTTVAPKHPAFRTQWLERLIPRSPRWTALSPPFWIVSDFHRHRDDGPSRSFRRQHRDAGTTRLWPSAAAPSSFAVLFTATNRTPQAATASRPAYRDDRETPLITGQDKKEYSPINEIVKEWVRAITKCFGLVARIQRSEMRTAPA